MAHLHPWNPFRNHFQSMPKAGYCKGENNWNPHFSVLQDQIKSTSENPPVCFLPVNGWWQVAASCDTVGIDF